MCVGFNGVPVRCIIIIFLSAFFSLSPPSLRKLLHVILLRECMYMIIFLLFYRNPPPAFAHGGAKYYVRLWFTHKLSCRWVDVFEFAKCCEMDTKLFTKWLAGLRCSHGCWIIWRLYFESNYFSVQACIVCCLYCIRWALIPKYIPDNK